jgi:transitional endoplasmic reticulum ATPase
MPAFEPGMRPRQWEQANRPATNQENQSTTMDQPADTFYDHSTAKRVNTDLVITDAIRKEYPHQNVTTVPVWSADLLQFAASGHATADIFKDDKAATVKWRQFIAPVRRLEPETGGLADNILFAKYVYSWGEHEFIMYYVNGRDGPMGFSHEVVNQYLVGGDAAEADALILAAGRFSASLHDEIWVFDQGYWQKDRELWRSIQNASWGNVILDEGMKKQLKGDAQRFFDAREEYAKLGVPWKRGTIFHGPPGNGKTISIKATMHMLYDREDPVPTLYVKTLAAFYPPEFALGLIFEKARREAPCYLVFEDLDSVVSDGVRSFFLNEVDGLSSNDGIFMVGSTNHLDLLDPGISKRPSRFDRKYFFPNPNFEQRVQYCHYWQGKLKDNKDVKFPDSLCKAIAKITDGFSFAYIQEAFVAALLSIAYSKHDEEEEEENDGNVHDDEWEMLESTVGQKMAELEISNGMMHQEDKSGTTKPDDHRLDDNVLWLEIRKQISLLRKELDVST